MSRSLSDTIQYWQDENNAGRLEGDKGVENLHRLCDRIGYPGHPHKYGSPLEAFLADNPGAMEAIVQWIEEQDSDDWRECLETELNHDSPYFEEDEGNE